MWCLFGAVVTAFFLATEKSPYFIGVGNGDCDFDGYESAAGEVCILEGDWDDGRTYGVLNCVLVLGTEWCLFSGYYLVSGLGLFVYHC